MTILHQKRTASPLGACGIPQTCIGASVWNDLQEQTLYALYKLTTYPQKSAHISTDPVLDQNSWDHSPLYDTNQPRILPYT